MRRTLIAALSSLSLACGLEAQEPQSTNTEPLAQSAQARLSGRYLGTGTVTQADASPRCPQEVGKVNSTGLEFGADGQVIGWIGHGGWFQSCTTTYAGLSVVVACSSGGGADALAIEYRLAFDANAQSVTGTYALTGSGIYCPSFKQDVALAREP